MTKEAKTRKCELVAEAVRITLEENNALAKGNTEAMMLANMEAMMLANMEAFDYGFVAKKDLKMAKKWFNAPKVRKNPKDSVSVSAHYYWCIWNDVSYSRYKGNAIIEKATEKSLLLHPPKIKTRMGALKRRARKRGARKRRWRRRWRGCGWSRGGVGFRLSVLNDGFFFLDE